MIGLFCFALLALDEREGQANQPASDAIRLDVSVGSKATFEEGPVLALPAQPVDATQALNLSAGVSNCKVSRGRSLRKSEGPSKLPIGQSSFPVSTRGSGSGNQ
jgi:hypothetical protein